MPTLLSERANKRYIVVAERHNDNLNRLVTESHIIEAPTLPEVVILAEPVLAVTDPSGHPARLLSVRETKVYPQSFMEADESTMIEVLKDLADHHPDITAHIDEIVECFTSYNDDLDFDDAVRTVIDMLLMIPGLDRIDCSVIRDEYDDDYVMIEHYCWSLGDLYLSRGTELHSLTNDRSAEGAPGLAALVCGIRDMLARLV